MCDENMNLEEQVTEPVEPKVETEPLFEEMVDFDTFSKSDFRVVKVKECSAVKKCTDPQMLDQKSNDWRSIFLWLNIVLNLKRK